MASQRSHLAISTAVGIGYAATGIVIFRVHPEFALLSALLALAAGLLPNIDNGPSSPSGQELSGFIATLTPLIILELYPSIRGGGQARIILVVMICYLFARVVILHFLKRYARSRGPLHSIPAAILVFEMVYLMLWDLLPFDRLFLAGAALAGYSAHLILDGFSNFDLTGTADRKPPALKVGTGNWLASGAVYLLILLLAWTIARDLFPQIQLRAPVDI